MDTGYLADPKLNTPQLYNLAANILRSDSDSEIVLFATITRIRIPHDAAFKPPCITPAPPRRIPGEPLSVL